MLGHTKTETRPGASLVGLLTKNRAARRTKPVPIQQPASSKAGRRVSVPVPAGVHHAAPMSTAKRLVGYLEQTGRPAITPRQARRARHKLNREAGRG